jgi:large subunit ribosomal protein L14e
MPIIEIGQICVKTTGREAGLKCVVVDVIDKNFILVTGPKKVNGVKRRKVNIKHIEPTKDKLTISKGATDEEVTEALTKAKNLEGMSKPIKPKLKAK